VPLIALKVIRMICDDDYRLDDVAEELLQDQVIAAKILHVEIQRGSPVGQAEYGAIGARIRANRPGQEGVPGHD